MPSSACRHLSRLSRRWLIWLNAALLHLSPPATGIETIDPTDAVIENPGAKTARIVKVIPIAPIDSVSRRKLDSDLSDTPSLSARIANSAIARNTGPSGRDALIGG